MFTRRDGLKLLLVASALPLAACGGTTPSGGGRPSGSVLEVARASGARKFARAVEQTSLAARLADAGPYTIFAPSDRAMSSASLPADPAALLKLLSYHVVAGDFTGDFLRGVDINYTTLAGSSLNVDGTGTGLLVNGAGVVSADNVASNGVVHVIDQVLKPR